MNCIAAVSRDWGIGREGGLLFHISEDMKLFRRLTIGRTLILGRRCLESFPGGRPLPRRRSLVLSRDRGFTPDGAEVCRCPAEALEKIRDLDEDDVWVIGGGEIYRIFLPYCRLAYITQVDAAPEADVFFPDLTAEPGWEQRERGDLLTENGLPFRFCVYGNTQPRAF